MPWNNTNVLEVHCGWASTRPLFSSSPPPTTDMPGRGWLGICEQSPISSWKCSFSADTLVKDRLCWGRGINRQFSKRHRWACNWAGLQMTFWRFWWFQWITSKLIIFRVWTIGDVGVCFLPSSLSACRSICCRKRDSEQKIPHATCSNLDWHTDSYSGDDYCMSPMNNLRVWVWHLEPSLRKGTTTQNNALRAKLYCRRHSASRPHRSHAEESYYFEYCFGDESTRSEIAFRGPLSSTTNSCNL